MTLVLTTAPASMVLNGYTVTPEDRNASCSTTHSSPTTAPSSIRAPRITSVFLPITHPRRVTPAPTKTLSCSTARSSTAPEVTTALLPMTVYSRSSAPASTRA